MVILEYVGDQGTIICMGSVRNIRIIRTCHLTVLKELKS